MKKKYVVLLIALVFVIGVVITAVSIKSSIEAELMGLKDLPLEDVDLKLIPDGVYNGSYSAFPVAADVKVTVAGHEITGIQIVKHDNGRGKPAEVIPQKVVEAQALDVELVSGATYSSKVILKAIENALLNAGKQ